MTTPGPSDLQSAVQQAGTAIAAEAPPPSTQPVKPRFAPAVAAVAVLLAIAAGVWASRQPLVEPLDPTEERRQMEQVLDQVDDGIKAARERTGRVPESLTTLGFDVLPFTYVVTDSVYELRGPDDMPPIAVRRGPSNRAGAPLGQVRP